MPQNLCLNPQDVMLKSSKQNHHQPQVFVVKSSVLMVLSLILAGKHQPFSTVKSPQEISGPLVVPMRCFAMPNRPKKVREGRIWAVESLFFRWKNMACSLEKHGNLSLILQGFFCDGIFNQNWCSFHNSLVVNGGNYLELSIFNGERGKELRIGFANHV